MSHCFGLKFKSEIIKKNKKQQYKTKLMLIK